MVNTYEIAGFRFKANSLIDATVLALHKVRELSSRDAHDDAKRLFRAVWRIQDEIQDAVSNQLPFPTRYRVSEQRLTERPLAMLR